MKRSGHAVAVAVGILLGCGKTVATLSYDHVGETKETPLALSSGRNVGFAVHVGTYWYSGKNHVVVDAELLRGGNVVEKLSCKGFELEGSAGNGCYSTHYNSTCRMTVPEGGADAVRVTTRMENDNDVGIDGLEVRVKL